MDVERVEGQGKRAIVTYVVKYSGRHMSMRCIGLPLAIASNRAGVMCEMRRWVGKPHLSQAMSFF